MKNYNNHLADLDSMSNDLENIGGTLDANLIAVKRQIEKQKKLRFKIDTCLARIDSILEADIP